MKSKKPSKPTKKDKDWQEKVEEKSKAEKVELGHPQGRERFEKTIRQLGKGGSTKK